MSDTRQLPSKRFQLKLDTVCPNGRQMPGKIWILLDVGMSLSRWPYCLIFARHGKI